MCRRGGSEVGLQKPCGRGDGSQRGLAGVFRRFVWQGGRVSKGSDRGLQKICATGVAGLKWIFGSRAAGGADRGRFQRGLRKICAAGGAGLKGI
uniref:Uncharacterized protein n=1 Tax=Chromera velia CCMP2878 TaxID=1169474 RepID=A0A0G4FKF4_9ALVE|eukprot:Cvel_17460.t1-p1 / transcript=Cvel_17460.t1 / gene=Cvel_17460 / organism=Chromera_velia_CCMP2878 / gene_product=hypothetical protein / transcript_product=hypothetical protein / location=Cvel_scaffold1394:29214-29492(-) / protein_length=93 / sequence_SO=supercontig / SO=protein_coding / is_pseudo=false